MKEIYRGCEIESKEEESLGGWNEVYWSAFQLKDGYEICSGFGGGSVKEMFETMKKRVDTFLDEYKGNKEKNA